MQAQIESRRGQPQQRVDSLVGGVSEGKEDLVDGFLVPEADLLEDEDAHEAGVTGVLGGVEGGGGG